MPVLGSLHDPNTVLIFQWTSEVNPLCYYLFIFVFWTLWILKFSISRKLRTPVDWFLWVPCYSSMFVFCDIRHIYYVFSSLVNLSTVNSFSHFLDSTVPLSPTLLSSLMSSQLLTRVLFQLSDP